MSNPALSQYQHTTNTYDRHQQLKNQINAMMTHPLKDYPTVFEQVMAWGDMDIFQHLNNVRYYEYAQSARIDHLGRYGFFDKGNYTVIVATSCQYLHSVLFPDTLWIGVRLKKIGNTSLTHEYCYYSTAQKRIVALGESVVVHMNAQGEKQAFNDNQKTIMAQFF